jgi:hypothetical protein
MATYAAPPEDGTYFMDVQLSPATVKSGAVGKRLNPVVFPERGVISKATVVPVVTASSLTPAEHTQVTLTAAFTPPFGAFYGTPNGAFVFRDADANISPPLPASAKGTATLTTSSLAQGAHSITAVFASDDLYLNATSRAVTVTVS